MKRKTCFNCKHLEDGHCNQDWTLLDGPMVVQRIDNCADYEPIAIAPNPSRADSTRLRQAKEAANPQYRRIAKRNGGYTVFNCINVGELGKEDAKHFETLGALEDFIY